MKQFIFFFIIFKFYYGNYVHNMKIIQFPFLHSFDFTFDMIKVKIVLKNDKIVYSSLSLFQDFTFLISLIQKRIEFGYDLQLTCSGF